MLLPQRGLLTEGRQRIQECGRSATCRQEKVEQKEATSGWAQVWQVAVSWALHRIFRGTSWALRTVMALDSGEELWPLRDSENVRGFQEEQSLVAVLVGLWVTRNWDL